MTAVLRIIDANANRAREGLRVLEDAARFVLNNGALSARCKQARHDIRAALDLLPADDLARTAHRDTPNDVGTATTTESEHTRSTVADVAAAAAKRAQEALRTIEEFAKTLQPTGVACAERIERVRYAVYDVERALLLALGSSPAAWRLCVLVTESLCTHHSWQRVAELACLGGASAIQLREKHLPAREVLARARELRSITRAHDAALVINDRVDIAAASDADAVHLGQTDLRVHDARRIAGGTLRVGVSVTTIEQARDAAAEGADYAGVGPTFRTSTKARTGSAPPGGRTDNSLAGTQLISAYAGHTPPLPPMLAIGGITASNAAAAVGAGATGLAVSACVCESPDPGAVCGALLDAFNSTA